MTRTSRQIVFVSLQVAPNRLVHLTQAAEAAARQDPPLPFTVAPLARRGADAPDRRVMVVFLETPSHGDALQTLQAVTRGVARDIDVHLVLHYSDGTEVPLTKPGVMRTPASAP